MLMLAANMATMNTKIEPPKQANQRLSVLLVFMCFIFIGLSFEFYRTAIILLH